MITLALARPALAAYRPQEADAPGAGRAAVALVLVEGADGLEALFIRRAEREDDPWSGQVAFPGGRYDPADRDLAATAIRETREETGVQLNGAERLGVLDDLYPRTSTLPPVVVRPFVFTLPGRPALVASAEVERAFWLPLEWLVRPGVRRALTLSVSGRVGTFPAYAVDVDVIWGMTERILTPFLHVIRLL